MSLKPIVLACLAVFAPGVAHAQYQMISPMLYEGPRISLQDHAARSRAAPPGARPEAARPRPPAAMSFTYRPDAARRRANLAQFVAKTRAVDPAGADQLAKLFASQDVIQRVQGLIAPSGLRVDNVADAYAVYWITAYNATRGINPTPSRPMLTAVKEQAMDAMGATAEFRAATDATKQELAEALWIQTVMLDTAVEQAKDQPSTLAAIGKAAAKGARGMGLDLSDMTLTEDGFVPTRDLGAVDPAPGEAPTALAAVDEGGGAPSLMLLAALGGTGIGGAYLYGKLFGRKG